MSVLLGALLPIMPNSADHHLQHTYRGREGRREREGERTSLKDWDGSTVDTMLAILCPWKQCKCYLRQGTLVRSHGERTWCMGRRRRHEGARGTGCGLRHRVKRVEGWAAGRAGHLWSLGKQNWKRYFLTWFVWKRAQAWSSLQGCGLSGLSLDPSAFPSSRCALGEGGLQRPAAKAASTGSADMSTSCHYIPQPRASFGD